MYEYRVQYPILGYGVIALQKQASCPGTTGLPFRPVPSANFKRIGVRISSSNLYVLSGLQSGPSVSDIYIIIWLSSSLCMARVKVILSSSHPKLSRSHTRCQVQTHTVKFTHLLSSSHRYSLKITPIL